jgi:hypothetical protein
MPRWSYGKPEQTKPDYERLYADACAACGGRPAIYLGRNKVFCGIHKEEARQDLQGRWKKVDK